MTIYDYRIGIDANFTSGTGTISVNSGSKNVTGTTTAFDTELTSGAVIKVSGIILAVDQVTSPTSLTLQSQSPITITTQAFTLNNLKNVETLVAGEMSAPKGEYWPWVLTLDTEDGLARGMGRPRAAWLWNHGQSDFLTKALRNQLRGFFPTIFDKSVRGYIRTKTTENDDAYKTYEAAILWVDKEDRDAGRRLNFELQFRDMLLL